LDEGLEGGGGLTEGDKFGYYSYFMIILYFYRYK